MLLPSRLTAIAVLILSHGLGDAAPQNDADKSPEVSFGTFPLPLKRTYVFSNLGTPVSKAKEMDSPFPDDIPPATVVAFEDQRRYPSLEKGPRYLMTAKNILRVFNIAALKTAPYKTIQSDVDSLRELLKHRRAISSLDDTAPGREWLPDYPRRNAGHLIDVKCSYLDAKWGSGVFYVTQFYQDDSSPDNEQLVYILQGLSKDNRYYISADFRVTHPALTTVDKKSTRDDKAQLTLKLGTIMEKDRDEAFTPSLKRIREWAATLEIE
jgi:hypothetical protein